MPRLGRDDTWRVVVALQRLCALDEPMATNLGMQRVLGRLKQRAHQAGMGAPTCNRNSLFSLLDSKGESMKLQPRTSIEQVEEGLELAPQFGIDGLLPCITTDAGSGEVLMLGWMNAEALQLTIATHEAHYFSRSRQALWRKGASSGLVQRVVEMRIDDDQDALWLRVEVQAGAYSPAASCHVGYRSCFYRAIEAKTGSLRFVESSKTFDPQIVYGDAPNPTVL